eukprot:304520-Hanusia_phi.AAC.3
MPRAFEAVCSLERRNHIPILPVAPRQESPISHSKCVALWRLFRSHPPIEHVPSEVSGLICHGTNRDVCAHRHFPVHVSRNEMRDERRESEREREGGREDSECLWQHAMVERRDGSGVEETMRERVVMVMWQEILVSSPAQWYHGAFHHSQRQQHPVYGVATCPCPSSLSPASMCYHSLPWMR